MHSLVPLERVAEKAGVAPWCQVYLPNDRTAALALLARVRAAGSEVIVLTVDVPVGGNREYNLRNGFTMPMRLGLRTVFDGLMHPRWLASVYLGRSWDELRNWAERRDTQTWEHLAWLRAAWRGKLLLKGILRADDARRAVLHGVDGVIVSNHGGRQLDGAPAALEALPAIAAAVGGHAAVLLDGGVCRGSDVVKALALGAEMVLVGRAALYGAAAAGEAGARRALDILRSEVDRVLALVGCNSVVELDPSWLAVDSHNVVDARARRAAPHGPAWRRTVAVTGGGGFREGGLVAAKMP
jgi:isopentenyl diphosphate isomerase/L-lactate dehydrogenase-like FMN-dependent dehydrogenase